MNTYFNGGMETVEGWLSPTTARMMHDLARYQTTRGVRGDVAEIGIYHGKSFFPLATALAEGEKAIAIDVFDDQHKNLDQSGADPDKSSLKTFLRHKEQFAPNVPIEIVQESSLDLHRLGFVKRMRGRIRFFSIDGSHTREATLNDLRIAEATLCEGGLVTLDDILSSHWLGVISGLFDYLSGKGLRRYLTGGGKLRPLAIAPNKLILCDQSRFAAEWTAFLLAEYGSALAKRGVALFSHPIDVFEERR